METTIQNEGFSLVVSELGAETRRLTHRPTGLELLWDGAPEIWPRRAPICFPVCGAVEDGWFTGPDGERCGLGQHGFVRDRSFTLAGRTADSLTYRLDFRGEPGLWPWAFSFETRHELLADGIRTVCTVTSEDSRPMPVQFGFHTGLRCPITPGTPPERCRLRFEKPESPTGGDVLELSADPFAADSLRLDAPSSRWVQVEEADTGRYLRVSTAGYPGVVLWSKPKTPGFVCIEPWDGRPGPGHDLMKRPNAYPLAPGESRSWTQTLWVRMG